MCQSWSTELVSGYEVEFVVRLALSASLYAVVVPRIPHFSGVRPFARGYLEVLGGELYAINVACLDGVDPAELIAAQTRYSDGRNDSWQGTPAETGHL